MDASARQAAALRSRPCVASQQMRCDACARVEMMPCLREVSAAGVLINISGWDWLLRRVPDGEACPRVAMPRRAVLCYAAAQRASCTAAVGSSGAVVEPE
eukprot:jgi/Ulvmu1/8160/UM040_0057.1